MAQDTENSFVPRAPRFKVADTSQINVAIKRTGEGNSEPLPAELLDVSQHGAKLRVPVNLRFEEALQLEIDVLDSEIEYRGIASVRHIRAVDDEHWVVGCAIAPPLSDETFSFLATTAGKERRRFRRMNIAAEALVRRQAQAEGVSAALHNLSSGGFCFSSADHYEVGERVQLSLVDNEDNSRVVEARICWQVDSPDGSIAGCQFTSNESYADLCACLTEQPVVASRNRGQAAPTSKLVLTAAVLAMFVPPIMTLLMQSNKVAAGGAPREVGLAEVEAPSTESVTPSSTANNQPDNEVLQELVRESLGLASENDPDESIAQVEASSHQHAADEEAPIEQAAAVREWVDNTGKYRTLAKLIEVTDEHVVLLKPDGKQSKVPWNRLSLTDQEFARDWRASDK